MLPPTLTVLVKSLVLQCTEYFSLSFDVSQSLLQQHTRDFKLVPLTVSRDPALVEYLLVFIYEAENSLITTPS